MGKNLLLLGLLGLIFADFAFGAGTTGLPWESPLETLRNSLTGPVAFSLSIVGILAAGAGLIFGGDINGFLRGACILVLVIALIVGATSALTTLFGVNGAVIG